MSMTTDSLETTTPMWTTRCALGWTVARRVWCNGTISQLDKRGKGQSEQRELCCRGNESRTHYCACRLFFSNKALAVWEGREPRQVGLTTFTGSSDRDRSPVLGLRNRQGRDREEEDARERHQEKEENEQVG